jgi:hypothetical protein
MKAIRYFFPLFVLVVSACTDPITVGSELLEDDRATVGQIVDIPFTTRVLRSDSLFSYGPGQTQLLPGLTFGQLDDPDFGDVRHSVYLTPGLPQRQIGPNVFEVIPPPFADNSDHTIDSIVLLLPIDTARTFYGDGRRFPISVRQIASPVTFEESYFTDISVATDSEELSATAELRLTERPTLVRDTAIFGRELFRPHLRVRFSDGLVDQFREYGLDDFDTDSVFRQRFPGVFLQPQGVSEALVTLAPNEIAQVDTVYNGFNVYYTDSLGEPRQYRIGLLQALPRYEYDFTGSLVETLLDDGPDSELVAVAGQGGLVTEISFNDLSAFRDRIINRAQLTISVADVDGVDYAAFPPPPRLELWYRATADGGLLPIGDRTELIRASASSAVTDFFIDGNIGDDQTYETAFSIHMQRILEGTVPPRMYLRVTPIALNRGAFLPNRAFLNGPAAAERPARISLTFTDLN